jgi:hypothetical protein
MRDLAKSMISWAWAVSVFSALQSARLIAPKAVPNGEAAAVAFNTVTDAASDLLSAPAKTAWKVGVAAQDVLFQAIAKTTPGTASANEAHTEEDAAEEASAVRSGGEPMPIESLGSARREPHAV